MKTTLYDHPPRPFNTIYVGTRSPGHTVRVLADGLSLSPLESLALRNHSPDGFNWGYGGSGPAQLALALLLHATRGNTECALDLYQRFKFAVVGGWREDTWVTTRAEILQWISEQPGHLEGREWAAEGGVT